jgi:hypothetical protein
MKLAFLLATIGLALTLEAQAQPLGSLAQIAVIDRETGVALSPHYYRGEYWVAGPAGCESRSSISRPGAALEQSGAR